MGRPQKKTTDAMIFINETLSDEHVSDTCNALFIKMANVDNQKNPEAYEKAELEYEEAWLADVEKNESIRPQGYSEADWISEKAKCFAKAALARYSSNLDVEQIWKDATQQAVVAIMTSGKYDTLEPQGKKAAYIKKVTIAKVTDYLRPIKIAFERGLFREDNEKILARLEAVNYSEEN